MTNFQIECKNHSNSVFFVSNELDDWKMEHHQDVLKLEEHTKKYPKCSFLATKIGVTFS
ncbi:MAG: hypothetical protein HOD60_12415 [Candidatus Nitrosopelagicus sp.]|jgi:hypothetical protein|nr:hypothetical protein [Candidatus Nitrosopelagicus sp.]